MDLNSLNLSLFLIVIFDHLFVNCSSRDLTTVKFLKSAGYEFETHRVITEDGYILTLHRILRRVKNNQKPVLLIHPMTSAGGFWVAPFISNAKPTALYLSDQGYDVWIMHHRGTSESPYHRYIKNSEKKYWYFTLHDLAIFDIPACVDYVLNVTRAQNLHCVGMSQGSTCILMLLASKVEYNSKISSAYLMTPPGSFKYVAPLLKLIVDSEITQLVINYVTANGIYFAPLSDKIFSKALKTFVSSEIGLELFINSVSLTFGTFDKSLNISYLRDVITDGGVFDNVGLWAVNHYKQCYQSNRFVLYDYGFKLNQKKYGKNTPPQYNLSLIDVPITLMSAESDLLATRKDVLRLRGMIKNARILKVPGNHFDFFGTPKTMKKVLTDLVQFISDKN